MKLVLSKEEQNSQPLGNQPTNKTKGEVCSRRNNKPEEIPISKESGWNLGEVSYLFDN